MTSTPLPRHRSKQFQTLRALALGLAIGFSGVLRDSISQLATDGALGKAFEGPAAGYLVVYQIEIVLLFATLAVIGPMVRGCSRRTTRQPGFGLAQYPG